MRCSKVQFLYEEYAGECIAVETAQRIDNHLASCQACRELYEANDDLHELIVHGSEVPHPGEGYVESMTERVLAELDKEDSFTDRRLPRPIARTAQKPFSTRPIWFAGSIAASLLLGLSLGSVLLKQDNFSEIENIAALDGRVISPVATPISAQSDWIAPSGPDLRIENVSAELQPEDRIRIFPPGISSRSAIVPTQVSESTPLDPNRFLARWIVVMRAPAMMSSSRVQFSSEKRALDLLVRFGDIANKIGTEGRELVFSTGEKAIGFAEANFGMDDTEAGSTSFAPSPIMSEEDSLNYSLKLLIRGTRAAQQELLNALPILAPPVRDKFLGGYNVIKRWPTYSSQAQVFALAEENLVAGNVGAAQEGYEEISKVDPDTGIGTLAILRLGDIAFYNDARFDRASEYYKGIRPRLTELYLPPPEVQRIEYLCDLMDTYNINEWEPLKQLDKVRTGDLEQVTSSLSALCNDLHSCGLVVDGAMIMVERIDTEKPPQNLEISADLISFFESDVDHQHDPMAQARLCLAIGDLVRLKNDADLSSRGIDAYRKVIELKVDPGLASSANAGLRILLDRNLNRDRF